jgi:hypothetical protein
MVGPEHPDALARLFSIIYGDLERLARSRMAAERADRTLQPTAPCRLTNSTSQRGGAFLTNPITLTSEVSFSTAFQFRITDPRGISDLDGQGAEGIVFVVQTVANNVVGTGGGIGYSGIANSVGVELDTWNNGGIDGGNGNHVGIDINGSVDSVARRNVDIGTMGRMNNGEVWSVWVDNDGATDDLEVRISTDGLRPLDAFLSYNVDLVSILGSTDAFVGFTSGTGAAGGDHDILNWTFEDDFAPIGVPPTTDPIPEPATMLLLGIGALGTAGSRRRRQRRAAAASDQYRTLTRFQGPLTGPQMGPAPSTKARASFR